MRRHIVGIVLASAIALAGCGGNGSGTLEIIENGTYDVNGYSQVVVNVGAATEGVPNVNDGNQPENALQELKLKRVQFRGFSMEVPEDMVEGYTDKELTENTSINLRGDGNHYSASYNPASISITMDSGASDLIKLEDITDAPQEDVNGITMAIRHEHFGGSRLIEVIFDYDGARYRINLMHPVEFDSVYADYDDQFYRTIEMN